MQELPGEIGYQSFAAFGLQGRGLSGDKKRRAGDFGLFMRKLQGAFQKSFGISGRT